MDPQPSTTLQRDLREQIESIYHSLVKFGCRLIEPTSHKGIHSAMDIYFQPSDERL